jgi:hypothetical protein
MLTGRAIQAFVFQSEPFQRASADDVRLYDLIYIRQRHAAVPYRIRIDDQIGSMLALIKTSGLIRADPSVKSSLSQLLLECLLQFSVARRIAASPRMPRWTGVSTEENVAFEFRHETRLQQWRTSVASGQWLVISG